MRIEELDEEIQDGTLVEDSEFWPPHPDLAAAKAAIIAGWNAALAAMKRYVAGRYHAEAPSGYRWHCDCCGDGLNRQQGRHNPETCIVAAQQAALAVMEGTDDRD